MIKPVYSIMLATKLANSALAAVINYENDCINGYTASGSKDCQPK
jgi:hypothetical protein